MGVSPDEKKALDWAISDLRRCADRMTVKAGKQFYETVFARVLADWLTESPELASKHVKHLLDGGRARDDVQYFCRAVALLIERGGQIPDSVRPFLVEFLRGNIKTKTG